MYAQKSFIEEVIKIGIDGCLLKNNTGKELISALHRVRDGKAYYDRINTFVQQTNKVMQYTLSDREIEIIQAIADGLSSGEIARKLFISVHTVKTHRKNILKKLGLKNSATLIQYALNNKII